MENCRNLQFAPSYGCFFDNAGRNLGNSFVKQNPFADRGYIALSVKYGL